MRIYRTCAQVLVAFLALAIFCFLCRATEVAAGADFDIQQFIDSQLQAGKTQIVIPPGLYHVRPHDRQHLFLHDLTDVTIIADGVEMICAETTRALTLSHCTNVTVRGLVIDYDPLPFTQGRITALSPDKTVQNIELFDGYPSAESAYNFKYEIFRPDTRTLRCSDRAVRSVRVMDSRHLQILAPREEADSPEMVGDLIVIGSRHEPHGSMAHAVECNHCSHVRLEKIDLFASNCFGFIESGCDGTVYERCRIDRRPAINDPVKRADGRLRSLDADAYHSNDAVKGPSYLGCVAKFMGDDAVNIHGAYHLVTGSEGNKLRVLAKDEMNIRPGDPLEVVLYDGERLPDARALSVVSAGDILDSEREFLSKQRMDAGLKSARSLRHAYTITLDHEVSLPMGSVVCAANRVGNGFTVKDCDFGFNRSRGILIKASHGEVTGNHLEGCEMSAILVTPEWWWLEAGSSSDVNIVGNIIRHCRGVPICVEAMGGNGKIAPAGAHRDIIIANNTVDDCFMPGILVTSTAGLRVKNNSLALRKDSTRLPSIMREAGLSEPEPIIRIQCEP